MKFAAVADCHVWNHPIMGGESVNGLNERCRKTVAVLARAAKLADEHNAVLVIAGDLFDGVGPSPQMIKAVMDAIAAVRSVILVGNHDRVTDAPGDHACAPLASLPYAIVVDEPFALEGVVFIPPAPRGKPAHEWLSESLAKLVPQGSFAEERTIVAHFGIADENTPETHSRAALSIDDAFEIMDYYGFKRMFSGDYHERKLFKLRDMKVEQIGALCPTGWDNPGPDYGYVSIYDTTSMMSLVKQIPGPRFYETADSVEAALLHAKRDTYVKLRAPRGTSVPEGMLLVEDAARSDRSADDVKAATVGSVEDALIKSVEELIPEPLRAEVLARVKQAMAGG